MTSLAHQNKCRRGGRAGDARPNPSGCSGGTPSELPALRHQRNSIPGACLMAASADRSPPSAIGLRSSLFLPAATPFSARTSRVNCAALASRTWGEGGALFRISLGRQPGSDTAKDTAESLGSQAPLICGVRHE
jgi:hypothetical protein